MGAWPYRLIVIGTLLAAFLVGLHVPMIHHMMEEGGTHHWSVVGVTTLLAAGSVAGGWVLLRSGPPRDRR